LIVLFRLNDWARAERDAAQILQLLENIEQQVPCAEDRMQLESWRSHLTKIKAVTQAMVLWDKRQYRDAFESVRDTLGFPEVMNGAAQDQEGFVETLLKSVQGALTARPALHPGEESSFFRQGDFWVIRYQGHSAFLKATRGLQYLRFLLGSPGREFHVNEFLADIPDPMAAASAASGNGRLHEDGARCVTSGLNDGSPILDAKAKADYKRRLSELREELDEAERFSDPARAAKAQDEMNVITGQMASALGLGGRDRKTSSGAERARSAVTKSIKKTIQKVSETIPSLGLHLAARIKTGYFCSYTPHPDRPVAWKF
jgi:non-specific serine/threonine protein kinase